MTEKSKALEPQKQELAENEGTERTRECRCYSPRADIYETENEVIVLTDMPGVDETAIDITLEKNVLTINGYVEPNPMEGYSLAHVEYGMGDYQRKFKISNEIDRDGIEAMIKDGVLRLRLPKISSAVTQKITVKTAN